MIKLGFTTFQNRYISKSHSLNMWSNSPYVFINGIQISRWEGIPPPLSGDGRVHRGGKDLWRGWGEYLFSTESPLPSPLKRKHCFMINILINNYVSETPKPKQSFNFSLDGLIIRSDQATNHIHPHPIPHSSSYLTQVLSNQTKDLSRTYHTSV